MCVRTMETKRLKPNNTVMTKKKGPSIDLMASMKAASFLTILKMRKARNNLNNLKKRRMLDPPLICSLPSSPVFVAYITKGAIHRSATPSSTMTMSRTFHHFSFSLLTNCRKPLCKMRNTNSTRKMQRKTLSNTGHMGQPTLSVSPAMAMVFSPMTTPMKAWKYSPSTKSKAPVAALLSLLSLMDWKHLASPVLVCVTSACAMPTPSAPRRPLKGSRP
mmetsp:Transcript_99130/g.276041  ORF Transcript_99130/g.276041 Transcript_99130/m.276041 type:complete len:218 (+) Transcript_99130:953-1606(+)